MTTAPPPVTPNGTFRHGVHPAEHKDLTSGLPIERIPFPPELVLPLSQHIGAPAKPLVKVGDPVQRGQKIAEPGGFVSIALHAPATGRVSAIEHRLHPNGRLQPAIVIEVDPWASQALAVGTAVDPSALSPAEVVKRVQHAGLVGLGGAAFPSHVKMSVPDGKRVDFVVVNGCECEPYLTCDHRVMVERPEAVLRGTRILMQTTGATRGYIGIEANKPDAIATLRALVPEDIEVVPVRVKYPQGAEKLLIDAIFHQEVPTGGLPIDLHFLVNNVGTTAAMADLFDTGQPLIERVVTVTGPGITTPRNVLVPIGTPVRHVVDFCGGLTPNATHVLLGGPMMGQSQKSLDVPVLKGTSGILCLDDASVTVAQEYPCIRCGRCAEACPLRLNPQRIARYARNEHIEGLKANHVLNCFECASCSYVCPSGIPLVHWMRLGKALVRSAERKP